MARHNVKQRQGERGIFSVELAYSDLHDGHQLRPQQLYYTVSTFCAAYLFLFWFHFFLLQNILTPV